MSDTVITLLAVFGGFILLAFVIGAVIAIIVAGHFGSQGLGSDEEFARETLGYYQGWWARNQNGGDGATQHDDEGAPA